MEAAFRPAVHRERHVLARPFDVVRHEPRHVARTDAQIDEHRELAALVRFREHARQLRLRFFHAAERPERIDQEELRPARLVTAAALALEHVYAAREELARARVLADEVIREAADARGP